MKDSLYTILFIFMLGQFGHIGLPWWTLAPIAALAGWLIPQKAIQSFAAGFAGGFLLWLVAAYCLDSANDGLLAGKIGALFMGLSRWQILLLTGTIGGLVSALACLTGYWARGIFPFAKKTA